MRKNLLIAAGAACLAFTAAAANAATVVLSAGTGPGTANYAAFDDNAVGSTSGTTETYLGSVGWTSTQGNQGATYKSQVQDTSFPNEYLDPLNDPKNYVFAQGGGTVTLTLPSAVTSLTIYWGSPDTYNTILLSNGDTGDGTLLTTYGLVATPNGDNANSLWVTISDRGNPFQTVTFGSIGQPAFEFDLAGPVPETSTWAMMALGFAGLGYAAFRRSARNRAALAI